MEFAPGLKPDPHRVCLRMLHPAGTPLRTPPLPKGMATLICSVMARYAVAAPRALSSYLGLRAHQEDGHEGDGPGARRVQRLEDGAPRRGNVHALGGDVGRPELTLQDRKGRDEQNDAGGQDYAVPEAATVYKCARTRGRGYREGAGAQLSTVCSAANCAQRWLLPREVAKGTYPASVP